MKNVLLKVLFFALPIFTFTFFFLVSSHIDTEMHERVHAKICETMYGGDPKVTINFMGDGYTSCYNATITPEGQALDIQNEIEGYNGQSVKILMCLVITFITMLIVAMLSNDIEV